MDFRFDEHLIFFKHLNAKLVRFYRFFLAMKFCFVILDTGIE